MHLLSLLAQVAKGIQHDKQMYDTTTRILTCTQSTQETCLALRVYYI